MMGIPARAGGEEFEIVFRHSRAPHEPKKKEWVSAVLRWAKEEGYPLPQAVTECHIFSGNNDRIAVGRALCSPKDQFCYERGRKESLAQALLAGAAEHRLKSLEKADYTARDRRQAKWPKGNYLFTRVLRDEIWGSYFTRSRNGNNKKDEIKA